MKFKLFKDGRVLGDFDVAGAYLFGSDGIAVRRAEISFDKGVLKCSKENGESAGLVLRWPVKGFGQILLPTTCLPEREEPYILSVELARGKLMQIINKCEDWAFFAENGLSRHYNQARELFIKALQNISDAQAAAEIADKALERAFVFGEEIALYEAERQFRQRHREHSFGKGALGCRIDPEFVDKPVYISKFLDLFSYTVIPVNWADIESTKGEYDFSQIDKCITALRGKRVALGAGPLLRFDREYLPKWLTGQKLTFEKIRESAYRFIAEIVGRYGSKIRAWTVLSGLNSKNYFGFSFEQVLEMTRAANMAVKSTDPRIRKIIEVEDPWGQYYAENTGTIPPLVYMDMIVQSGVGFDAFGLKMDFNGNDSGVHARDMMQISTLLDYLRPIAKSFHITGVSAPNGNVVSKKQNNSKDEKAALLDSQSDWMKKFYITVLSKPFVGSVVYSALAGTSKGGGSVCGLVDEDFQAKKTYQSLKSIQKIIAGK